ncbi:putative reverse transcriptase zinc-binding domain-containing protein [Helianthus annuus]|nr:putative reverse transcriptase zinc-binding domain-containing protein [Helianthus annuus]
MFSGVSFRSLMQGCVGDGPGTYFWIEPWLCNTPLKDCFPIFRLESDKLCLVRDRIVRPVLNPNAKWDWMHAPNSNDEIAEWLALNVKLRDVVLSEKKDKWIWLGEDDGEFSVGSIKRLFDKGRDFSSRFVWDWCKWVPLKCNLFAWRAEMERIPTKVELRKRNIPILDDFYPMCESDRESATHLLTACSFSSEVWTKISRWCKVPNLVAFSVRDILEFHKFCGLKGRAMLAFKGIAIISCWQIWKARNERVFSDKSKKVEDVVSAIKSIGFLWFKNRSNYKDVTWDE